MMKAAIFDPYLDTLGGGEKYSLSVACVLRDLGWQVDLLWSGETTIITQAEKRFNLDLKGVNVKKSFFQDGRSLLSKLNESRKYDFLFFVSDGSVPLLGAKINWLHFQVPFHAVGGRSLKNRVKLRKIKRIIVNSRFTKNVIDQEFGVNSKIIYPPVDIKAFAPLKKTKTILYVGRFSNLLQGKRQQILVTVFKGLIKGGLKGWKLILAGGTTVGFNQDDIEKMKQSIRGFPVTLSFDPNFTKLAHLYGQSTFFWAAGGFGNDPVLSPEKMEHFGLTLVEAMAAKSVPLAVDLGGYSEVLNGSLSKLLWESTADLVRKTTELMTNEKELQKLQDEVHKRALDFSYEKFTMAIKANLEDDLS